MYKKVATLKHLDSAIAVLKQFTADVAKAASEAIKSLTAADVGALTEIKIGTVTTGAAGSKATASATTIGTVSTLNLTIPKGDKGDKGDTGATGPKGDPGTNATTTAAATQSANGLMSSADKKKLDGIAAGANVNTVTGIKGNAETTYRTGNVNLTPANIGAAASNHTHVSTGTVSVPATGWGSDSTAIFPKYYDLSISGILATDRVDLIVAIASLDTALKCGLCGITEASAGKVRIRSRTVPTAAISLQYWVMKK